MQNLIAMLDEWTNKDLGDGKYKVTPPGKVGVWRRAKKANKNLFIPDDGSAPVGMPKGKSSDSGETLEKAKKTLAMLQDKLKTGNKAQKKLAKQKIPSVKKLIAALQKGDSKGVNKAAGSV